MAQKDRFYSPLPPVKFNNLPRQARDKRARKALRNVFVPPQAYSFDDVCSLLAGGKFEGGDGRGDH
eukprot:COSAG06_NODE_25285_length_634_cov_1.791128_1_plen_65_part_01